MIILNAPNSGLFYYPKLDNYDDRYILTYDNGWIDSGSWRKRTNINVTRSIKNAINANWKVEYRLSALWT